MLKIKDLALKQKELDIFVHKNNNTDFKTTYKLREIALFVEIGELANEIRSFKFWAAKQKSNKLILLEEYSDCLHFLLSLGNDLEFDWDLIELNPKFEKQSINELLLNIFLQTSNFVQSNSKKDFLILFKKFLVLKTYLYFTNKEVFNSYYQKHSINITRQKTNY